MEYLPCEIRYMIYTIYKHDLNQRMKRIGRVIYESVEDLKKYNYLGWLQNTYKDGNIYIKKEENLSVYYDQIKMYEFDYNVVHFVWTLTDFSKNFFYKSVL